MRQLLLFGAILVFTGICICRGEAKVVRFFSSDQLDASINTHADDYDYLLIDIRTYLEVANGIIASRYCKPYHLSWDYGELQNNYRLIPDTTIVILYCQTGNRAIEAATFLSEKGFTRIGCLIDGLRTYTGELHDSTEFKPLSLLPQPSYFGDTTVAVISDYRSFFITPKAEKGSQLFTLQGQVVKQTRYTGTPCIIIRTGNRNSNHLLGLRH